MIESFPSHLDFVLINDIDIFSANQHTIVIERLSRLITSLTQYKRDTVFREVIVHHIAEVIIITRYLELIFEVEQEEIDNLIAWNIARLHSRLKNEDPSVIESTDTHQILLEAMRSIDLAVSIRSNQIMETLQS